MKNALSRFLKDEIGATALEYALLASLLGAGFMVVITFTGTSVSAKYLMMGTELNAIK